MHNLLYLLSLQIRTLPIGGSYTILFCIYTGSPKDAPFQYLAVYCQTRFKRRFFPRSPAFCSDLLMTISSLFRLLDNPIGPALEAFSPQALCMLRGDHLLL